MKLVVAEKPSVAQSLAAVLGAKEKKDGYLEGSGWLVSWCVGHLVELAQPEAYGEQYAKWRYADLPILPAHWKYDVAKDKKKQLGVLRRLMEDKRVDAVVCATDAGREGELIFRLVYQQAGCSKPILRLWISSMEDAAIRDGFEHLRPGADYDLLYQAALCRAGADWIVGINATRLFSVLYGDTLNVGRVMTPTLALIVQREDAIRSFKSKPFYVPELACGGFTAAGEKLEDKAASEAIRAACDGKPAVVRKVERQKKTIQPPRLYDLTTLQRECNRLYGFTAQQTLDYLQSLYEKKLATYPRTDSQYITADMQATVGSLALWLWQNMPFGKDSTTAPELEGIIDDSKVVNTAYLLVAGMLNQFGTAVSAASNVGLQINTFAGMPCWAIGQAVTAMVGQCMGAGQIERARKVVKISLVMNVVVTLVVVIGVQLFAEPLILLFGSTTPEVVNDGVYYLRVCCSINSLIYAVMYTLDSFAIGVGAANVAMINALLDAVIVRLPVSWLLAFVLNMGFSGIY